MEALLLSTGLVAIAEIGDKTQLLAILLAARWRKPWPIIAGIFVATLFNHGLASLLGSLAGDWLQGPWLRWVLGFAFIGFALWALIPDQLEQTKVQPERSASGIFVATAIVFFLVEMGDKTQVVTIALAARFQDVLWVTAGTTLGMMLANVPAVLIGEAAARSLPLNKVRLVAAGLFAATGLWVLWNG
jgi:putative Ca2+/H+ antiporter (TMEM165/GDT1 family)